MSAAGVVSVARIRDMSSREMRQLHSRNAALGASTRHSTSQGSMIPPLSAQYLVEVLAGTDYAQGVKDWLAALLLPFSPCGRGWIFQATAPM
jgi:hypothetical protein